MSALTLTSLTSPPPALTSAELALISVSTPSSFEGIAPLLRHKEESVELTIEPAFEGFKGGKGSLWITEGAVSFFSPSSSTGISIPYPLITLHAISRAALKPFSAPVDADSVEGGGPCIYCQIDETEGEENDANAEGTTREVIIVPSDASALDKIFEMLSTCAALHPPTSSDSSFFGGLDPSSTVYADADGNLAGGGMGIEQMTAEEESDMMSSAGRAARTHLEAAISWSIPKSVEDKEEEVRDNVAR